MVDFVNHDRAGRLTAANEIFEGLPRPLKTFTYAAASSGSDLRGGKLWIAERYNVAHSCGT